MIQLRLILAAGVVLVVVSLVAAVAIYRGDAISAKAEARQAAADRDAAVAANRAQAETIGRLRAAAEANDRLLASVADSIAAINAGVAETNQHLGDLKDANEDVRAYLAGRVPADLDRLLNR